MNIKAYESTENKTKKHCHIDKLLPKNSTQKRRTICAIAAFVVIAFGVFFIAKAIQYNNFFYQTILQLGTEIGTPDESWSVTTTDPSVATAEFKTDMGFEGYSLVISFHKPSVTELIIKNSDSKESRYVISITEDNNINVQAK